MDFHLWLAGRFLLPRNEKLVADTLTHKHQTLFVSSISTGSDCRHCDLQILSSPPMPNFAKVVPHGTTKRCGLTDRTRLAGTRRKIVHSLLGNLRSRHQNQRHRRIRSTRGRYSKTELHHIPSSKNVEKQRQSNGRETDRCRGPWAVQISRARRRRRTEQRGRTIAATGGTQKITR